MTWDLPATGGPGAPPAGPPRSSADGFVEIEGARWACIADVDALPPFLMSVVSDGDVWLFVGSNGPFTAGRRTPDTALFPYLPADRILRDPATGGARTIIHATRGTVTTRWEPWQGTARPDGITRNLYKRVDGTAVMFEEIEHAAGLRFRWSLSACDRFGLVRRASIQELRGEPVDIRYLDGWHQLLPPGVGQETFARYSYLAAAYMRHERLADVPLALHTLNSAISDRPEPSESLRVAVSWSLGHPSPRYLLDDTRLGAFRRGEAIIGDTEIRGELGAGLVVDALSLAPGGSHDWLTVADTGLDHAAVIELRALLRSPESARAALAEAVEADRLGVLRRVAEADGIQATGDEAVSANHQANVLYNVMRGGSFHQGCAIPVDDVATYLAEQDRAVAARHARWAGALPAGIRLPELLESAAAQGDPQLVRLMRAYLPLTFSRRHGDPSRPWNRFSIQVRDAAGQAIHGYEGNWRDIFQNWDALARSVPAYLPQFVAVFLDASTADGYNPYRITRRGIDWEVPDPRDPWSHIGYWGDHQIVYLHRLLDAWENHAPGAVRSQLDQPIHADADVPYRLAGYEATLADPRRTITFDRARHDALASARRTLGADGSLIRDERGEVRLVTLGEKLLVPLLAKLTNLVPDSGIWLNTQRPEWNDANNALAGWGLSRVTLCALSRYLDLLGEVIPLEGAMALSAPVAQLLDAVTGILATLPSGVDAATRLAVMERLGRAGEAHRDAVHAGHREPTVSVAHAAVRQLVEAASRVVRRTIRGGRRADGLYHSYDRLRLDGDRAEVVPLGTMLEGQVAVLESGLLDSDEVLALLGALRASDLYRADQNSYLLIPDRQIEPFLSRNTLLEPPPIADPALFVRDRDGGWHFHADLRTMSDVDARLESSGASEDERSAVRDLWRTTFDHAGFTGRSDRFFMFEGLGSIYWHMVAKLLLAVQGSHRAARDPSAQAALAVAYHDIRDGLGFRRSAASYGAFPTDPYSHSPRHRGAQQPGMTGQVKEQILSRLGEVGVEVAGGRLRIAPRLMRRSELLTAPAVIRWPDVDGREVLTDVPAGGMAFTYCGVPVLVLLGEEPSIELEHVDGRTTTVPGEWLDRPTSAAIFGRTGTYRRLTVRVREDRLQPG